MTFRQSEASLVELTMPPDAPLIGQRYGDIDWPADTALVAILREGRVIVPQQDDPLEAGTSCCSWPARTWRTSSLSYCPAADHRVGDTMLAPRLASQPTSQPTARNSGVSS